MRGRVFFSLALVFAWFSGCGVSEDSTCVTNDDCVERRLCSPEGRCVLLDPVSIVTQELPDANLDAEYKFVLEATDGIDPYKWSLSGSPEWMTIDEETGTLGGTPDRVATGLPVKVRVCDQTTGRDSFDEVELYIGVALCSDGETAVCYEPQEGKCLEGTKHCTNSDWSPCGEAKFSANKNHCGPDCGPCDEQISNRCHRGECACGDSAPCTSDEICCEAGCIDPDTDSQNCGACGAGCEEALHNVTNPRCEDGACVHDGCATGFLDCNDVFEDGCETAIGLDHCGECNRDCSTLVQNVSEALCDESHDCGYQEGLGCKFGFLDCDGDRQNGCETPADSQDHCGVCDNFCAARCMLHPDGDRYYCGCNQDQDCGQNQQCCNGTCFDKDDPANCGSCGNDCTLQVSHVEKILCTMGVCNYTECLPLYLDCDSNRSNGCETPMSNQNCGQCGFSCGQYGECIDASCACVAQRGNCNYDWSDGCEINLTNTVEHCGSCEINCNVQVHNASNIDCLASLCNYGTCNNDGEDEWDDCDDDRTNGCEANLINDNQNCGDCHLTCKLFNCHNFCESGVCQPTCMPGWGDCDNIPSNGCETGTVDNIVHCGECFSDCVDNIQNASGAVCLNSACNYSSCHSNYGDCDGDRTDGCETDLRASTPHCGSCDTNCNTQVQHASLVTCSNSLCNYGSCYSGYGDCDGNRRNGCEINLATVEHCGNCSTNCNIQVQHASSVTCSNSRCNYGSCYSGYGDCDGDRTDGCETDLYFNENNCGQCGKICTPPKDLCIDGFCQAPR